MFELRNISKSFGDVLVLTGVNHSLEEVLIHIFKGDDYIK